MNVIDTYDQVASEFSKTRNHTWADFGVFKKVVQRQMLSLFFLL